MKVIDEDLSDFEVKISESDIRLINTITYTGDHIDQIGKSWASKDPKHKLYIPLAQKEFDLDNIYEFSEGDVIGKVSIGEDNLNILTNIGKDNLPFKIIVPMNLGGGHWVSFAVLIDVNKQAKIYYSDSASKIHGPINKINNSTVEEASRVISSSLDKAGIKTIEEHTQDIKTKLNQNDGVSCGAYCLENAFRIFSESKLGENPSEIKIRSSQLEFLSHSTLRSASVSKKLSDMMYDLAANNQDLDHKSFRELLEREEFCKLLNTEYSKNDNDINNYKSMSSNELDLIVSNIGINDIYKTQKNIYEICKLILEDKLTVNEISSLIEIVIEEENGRSIREVELGVARRLMKIVNVDNLKQFDEYQKTQNIKTNENIISLDNTESVVVKIINFYKEIYHYILGIYNSILNERQSSFQVKDSPSNKSDLEAYHINKIKSENNQSQSTERNYMDNQNNSHQEKPNNQNNSHQERLKNQNDQKQGIIHR